MLCWQNFANQIFYHINLSAINNVVVNTAIACCVLRYMAVNKRVINVAIVTQWLTFQSTFGTKCYEAKWVFSTILTSFLLLLWSLPAFAIFECTS